MQPSPVRISLQPRAVQGISVGHVLLVGVGKGDRDTAIANVVSGRGVKCTSAGIVCCLSGLGGKRSGILEVATGDVVVVVVVGGR